MIFLVLTILLLFTVVLVWYNIPKYKKPRVIPNFVSEEEIEHIKRNSENKFHRSTVSINRNFDKNVRDSYTTWLDLNDPIINRVAERCVNITGKRIINCEKLQVLRYKKGGFYAPHQDVIEEQKNKRLYTFIIALNDDYEGGETEFPNLKRQFKLKKGDALFFHTLDNYKRQTPMALHGGKPVKSGEKWICNLWIHDDTYFY